MTISKEPSGIRKDAAALRQRLDILQTALEHMDEGFSIYDLELKMIAWNDRFFELLDLPRHLAYAGARFEDFMRFNAERGEYGPGEVEHLVRERVERALQFQPHILTRIRPDGTVLEIRGNPIPDVGFVTVYNDITENTLAQQALKDSVDNLEQRVQDRTAELRLANAKMMQEIDQRKQAEGILRQAQKMQAVGQLTGGLAHDFNNLLTIIMGNLALLHDEAPEEAVRDLTDPAMDAAQRGAGLVNRLLAFSRQTPLKMEVYDPMRVLTGMTELLRRSLGAAIEIDMQLGGSGWCIESDPSELESAVLNMALNSRDAMAEGGRLSLEVAEYAVDEAQAGEIGQIGPGDYVRISIRDSGHGMAPDVVERIFEPFFSAKPSGQGSGLGLSMVYGFVRRSEGQVTVESTPGAGTCIRLYLPRSHVAADAGGVAAPQSSCPGGEERIILVEDEAEVRRFAARVLGRLGYEVVEAGDANEALQALATEGSFQLMLSDIELPGGMNGVELAREARLRQPGIGLLMMSGYPDRVLQAEGDFLEETGLLSKPFERADLARMVRIRLDAATEEAG